MRQPWNSPRATHPGACQYSMMKRDASRMRWQGVLSHFLLRGFYSTTKSTLQLPTQVQCTSNHECHLPHGHCQAQRPKHHSSIFSQCVKLMCATGRGLSMRRQNPHDPAPLPTSRAVPPAGARPRVCCCPWSCRCCWPHGCGGRPWQRWVRRLQSQP